MINYSNGILCQSPTLIYAILFYFKLNYTMETPHCLWGCEGREDLFKWSLGVSVPTLPMAGRQGSAVADNPCHCFWSKLLHSLSGSACENKAEKPLNATPESQQDTTLPSYVLLLLSFKNSSETVLQKWIQLHPQHRAELRCSTLMLSPQWHSLTTSNLRRRNPSQQKNNWKKQKSHILPSIQDVIKYHTHHKVHHW